MREREAGASVVLHPAGEAVGFGPFRFDRANRILSRDGVDLPLPLRVLAVLEHLIARPGGVVSKQALLDAVWKDAFVTDTSLTEAVSQLRQILGDDPQQPTYIQTVHRRGYRFVAPLSADSAVPAPLRLAEKAALSPAASSESVASAPERRGPVVRGISLSTLATLAAIATALVLGILLRQTRPLSVPLTRAMLKVALGDANAIDRKSVV